MKCGVFGFLIRALHPPERILLHVELDLAKDIDLITSKKIYFVYL